MQRYLIHRAIGPTFSGTERVRVTIDFMGKKDPRIDDYIAKSADFARPVMHHLRALIHAGCPEVEETVKWSFPHFVHHGVLCGLAAFKHHCTFGFWKGDLIVKEGRATEKAMGQFGRITSVADLPGKKVLLDYIRAAARLNVAGIKRPVQRRAGTRKPLIVPECLAAALRRNAKARAAFDVFSYSHRREYIEWINEAKRDDTRQRRLQKAVDQMAEGKSLNWKYKKC